jgi:hypothetical protein
MTYTKITISEKIANAAVECKLKSKSIDSYEHVRYCLYTTWVLLDDESS